MKKKYRVNNYRGDKYRKSRRSKVLLTVICVVAAALIIGVVLHVTGNIEYTAEGPILGFGRREEKEDPAPSVTPVLVIDAGTEEPTPRTTPVPTLTPTPTPEPTPEPRITRPEKILAVYLPDVTDSAAVTGALELARAGYINTVVLELKHEDGSLEFISAEEYAIGAGANPASSEVETLIRQFHSAGTYVIGEMNAFEDSLVSNVYRPLSVATAGKVRWLDWQYHGWLDPYSEEAKDYLTALAKEIAALGADEILLDKCAFPTRGRPGLLYFPQEQQVSRVDILTAFAADLQASLADVGAELSFRFDLAWKDLVASGSGVDTARLGSFGEVFFNAQTPDGTDTAFSCAFTVQYSDAGAGNTARQYADAAGGGLILVSADGRYPAEW